MVIQYDNIQIHGAEAQGFEVSYSDGEVTVGPGYLTFGENERYEFEPFIFDVEGSSEFKTVYEMYGLEDGTVYIQRTEVDLLYGDVTYYTGPGPYMHFIGSVIIEAGQKVEDALVEIRLYENIEVIEDDPKASKN